MSDKLLTEIVALIEEKMGKYNKPIGRETSLERDLGISGDDAMEFIVSFGQRFDVDVSKFMAADYFNGEGMDILGIITKVIFGKSRERRDKKELKICHLENAVKAGRLDEEIICSSG